MDIIQFNAGGSTVPKLKQGELYIDLNKSELCIGNANQDTTATNDYFVIKSKPAISDIKNYNSSGYLTNVLTDIDISGGGNNATVFKFWANGEPKTNTPFYEKKITIQGTVANADHAGDAKKLVDINNADLSAGSASRPIWFTGGVPVVVDNIGSTGSGSWQPNIYASSIHTGNYYAPGTGYNNKILSVNGQSQFTYNISKGSASTPIYVDGGTLKECDSLPYAKFTQISTGKTIKSTSAGTSSLTTLSSLGITSGGFYMIMGEYNDVWYTFWIIIAGVTASSQTCFSTSSPYNSSTTTENICIQKTGANIAFKCTGTSVSSQMDSVTVYKLS